MLDTLSFPLSFSMNAEHKLPNAIYVHWFADSRSIHDRVTLVSDDEIHFENQNEFHGSFVTQVSLLNPCQVVIVEIPSTDEQSNAIRQLDYYESLISQALRHGTYPTIICVGDKLPAERVIRWMQFGVYSYAEISSDPSDILDLINNAKQHSSRILHKYLRFQQLQKLFNSFGTEDIAIMEMIFEGLPNKTIAQRLQLSQRTIEARRQRVFENLESKSLSIIVQKICEWHQLKKEFCSEQSA